MASATITVTSTYSNNPDETVTADDRISDTSSSSLSGSGDAAGAATDSEVPNANGGTDATHTAATPRNGGTFQEASVVITLDCGPDKPRLRLDATGNVSVSARVEGECITTKAVNRETDARGREVTRTQTRRECCTHVDEASVPPQQAAR